MVSELYTIHWVFFPSLMNPRYIYECIFLFYFPGTTYIDFNILVKELSPENLGFCPSHI